MTGILVLLTIGFLFASAVQVGVAGLVYAEKYFKPKRRPRVLKASAYFRGWTMRMVDLINGEREPISELETRFKEYHAENPQIFDLFDRFTREALDAGHRELGAKMIFERLRWETMVAAADAAYAINNNFSAYYARLWMEVHNRVDVFKTRSLRSEARILEAAE